MNISTIRTLQFLFLAVIMAFAFVAKAQDHHHHNDPNSVEAQMRKIYHGMEFHDFFDNNKLVNIESMPADTPVFIMFFSTDCGHCRLDAQKLPNLVPQYEIPFWMITAHDADLMAKFASDFKIKGIPNLLYLQDFSKKMHNWFEFRYVPFFALIDKKGNFIKEFEKLPTPEELKEVIRTNEFLEMYMK